MSAPSNIEPAASEKQRLYEAPPKIQPKSVKGYYRRLKDICLWVGLALYHLTPLIRWDRGEGRPDQAVLFDIPGQRIHFFNIEIWPQEIYILTGVMICAAIGLFLSASLWGRAWCGFTCFQTLWTDLFMKVEAWVEGDRNARMRLDQTPLNLKKFALRGIKHSLWLLISAFFALSFLWYFDDAYRTTADVFSGQISGWTLATFLTLLMMTYLMAGFAREQVCLYMCPYGRFQGVMFDDHSKVITYEDWRGEARGKPGKNRDFSARGHCVDCTLCVQVCPTGVDIRDGNQMGCIGCGLCIDACDNVMDKFGLPRKLISYDSQININKRAKTGKITIPKDWHLPRARTLAYLGILLVTISLTTIGYSSREMTKLTVLKERAPLFVTMRDGTIQNSYTLRILNKSDTDKSYHLSPGSDFTPTLKIHGYTNNRIDVDSGEILNLKVFAKHHNLAESATALTFTLTDQNGETTETETVFHSLTNRGN